MENKKFELCSDSKPWTDNIILHRIRALKDFVCDGIFIRKGDKGGFVQWEQNLSQDGNCWIFGNAVAMEDSTVKDNASLHDQAMIFDKSIVCDNASLYNFTAMFDKSMSAGNSVLSGHAKMHAQSVIIDNACIGGCAIACDNCIISGNAKVQGNTIIHGSASVSGNSKLFAYMEIGGDAKIESPSDVIILGLVGPDVDDCTFYKNTSNSISAYYKGEIIPIEILEENPYMNPHKEIIRLVKQIIV